MSRERFMDLNLTPPEEGFELYRYKSKLRLNGRHVRFRPHASGSSREVVRGIK
jgi:hypothetical protein